MARIEDVPEELLARLERRSKREEICRQAESILEQLPSGVWKQIVPDEGENPATLRARLRRVAREKGLSIELRRRGNVILARKG
jgi:hypothetical protein